MEIYVKSHEQYLEFKNWCNRQPLLEDKYGDAVNISKYLINLKNTFFNIEKCIYCGPVYIDAYIIRNCPLKYIQDELKLDYNESTYEEIKKDELYINPRSICMYISGFKIRCLHKPKIKRNKPQECKYWTVRIILPMGFHNIVYNEYPDNRIGTWDFTDDFVNHGFATHSCLCPTIKSLKRYIRKWNLPFGSIVRAYDKYNIYDFILL